MKPALKCTSLLNSAYSFSLYIKGTFSGLLSALSIEWLLFNANSANFQLYQGENKLIFNEMMMRFALF
jgi:hypothetical protein